MPARMIDVTVECFVEKDGKYLMLRRNPNKRIMPNVWIAPGGHVEFGEGVIAAARREIREETGLEIENIKIKVVGLADLRDIKSELCFHILTATYSSGELVSNPEDGELVWLTPTEITNLDNVLAELKPLTPLIFDKNRQEVISVRVAYEKVNEIKELEIEN